MAWDHCAAVGMAMGLTIATACGAEADESVADAGTDADTASVGAWSADKTPG